MAMSLIDVERSNDFEYVIINKTDSRKATR